MAHDMDSLIQPLSFMSDDHRRQRRISLCHWRGPYQGAASALRGLPHGELLVADVPTLYSICKCGIEEGRWPVDVVMAMIRIWTCGRAPLSREDHQGPWNGIGPRREGSG